MFSQLSRYAAELEVPIEEAEMDIRMSYDTRGKLLLADVSPGARGLEYVWDIKSPAPAERVRELVQMIERGCHTTNTVRNPTPVSARALHNGQELEL